jgi:hypothetical protein
MSVHDPSRDRFLAPAVCAAAGISPVILKSWVSRKPNIVMLHEDERPTVSAAPILYSFARVMQIAIMAQLVRAGWQPSHAADAAIVFTESGFPPERGPCDLFDSGDTFLVATGDNPGASQVVNIVAGSRWAAAKHEFGLGHGGTMATTIVDVGAVMRRVRAVLNQA